VNGCPPNLLSRHNKKQLEREFFENGKNQEIRKIRKNKQRCTKPEFPRDPGKKQESQKNLRWGWLFLNERGFSVESSLQRISSKVLLWKRNDSSVVL